jgi:hypothetical protein
MLDQADKLRQVREALFLCSVSFTYVFQPIAMFLASADDLYGPITTLRRENRLVKHIPWSAFKMADRDWTRVVDTRDILKVCFSINIISKFAFNYRILGFE